MVCLFSYKNFCTYEPELLGPRSILASLHKGGSASFPSSVSISQYDNLLLYDPHAGGTPAPQAIPRLPLLIVGLHIPRTFVPSSTRQF